jgi:hypothetical protein
MLFWFGRIFLKTLSLNLAFKLNMHLISSEKHQKIRSENLRWRMLYRRVLKKHKKEGWYIYYFVWNFRYTCKKIRPLNHNFFGWQKSLISNLNAKNVFLEVLWRFFLEVGHGTTGKADNGMGSSFSVSELPNVWWKLSDYLHS